MTTPATTSPRTPGVTGWIGEPVDAYLNCGAYQLRVVRLASMSTWMWSISHSGTDVVYATNIRANRGESYADTAIRIRAELERSIEKQLRAALAALRGSA